MSVDQKLLEIGTISLDGKAYAFVAAKEIPLKGKWMLDLKAISISLPLGTTTGTFFLNMFTGLSIKELQLGAGDVAQLVECLPSTRHCSWKEDQEFKSSSALQ